MNWKGLECKSDTGNWTGSSASAQEVQVTPLSVNDRNCTGQKSTYWFNVYLGRLHAHSPIAIYTFFYTFIRPPPPPPSTLKRSCLSFFLCSHQNELTTSIGVLKCSPVAGQCTADSTLNLIYLMEGSRAWRVGLETVQQISIAICKWCIFVNFWCSFTGCLCCKCCKLQLMQLQLVASVASAEQQQAALNCS